MKKLLIIISFFFIAQQGVCETIKEIKEPINSDLKNTLVLSNSKTMTSVRHIYCGKDCIHRIKDMRNKKKAGDTK